MSPSSINRSDYRLPSELEIAFYKDLRFLISCFTVEGVAERLGIKKSRVEAILNTNAKIYLSEWERLTDIMYKMRKEKLKKAKEMAIE